MNNNNQDTPNHRRSSERSPGSLLGSGQPPRGRGLQRFGKSESSYKHHPAGKTRITTWKPFCLTVRLRFTFDGSSVLCFFFPQKDLAPSSVTPELNLLWGNFRMRSVGRERCGVVRSETLRRSGSK